MQEAIRIIFMGTPEFAAASLAALLDAGKNIVAVVTTPDKPAGRGQQMRQSEVKELALARNLPVLQPEKLRDETFLAALQNFKADLFVVVAFRMLPEAVFTMPRLGTINLHASLLPHYRGAAPIQWAIINGETQTGVTTFFIEKEIDTGDIISSKRVLIDPNDTGGTLHDKLMTTGASLLTETVSAIESGIYATLSQSLLAPMGSPKLAPKIFKEDCQIHWDRPRDEVRNFIRALSPYPAAFTRIVTDKGRELSLRIFGAEPTLSKDSTSGNGGEPHFRETEHVPGTLRVTDSSQLCIATQTGWLSITSLQLEGKKQLPVSEFIKGAANLDQWRIL